MSTRNRKIMFLGSRALYRPPWLVAGIVFFSYTYFRLTAKLKYKLLQLSVVSSCICALSAFAAQHVSRGAHSVHTLDATQVCSRFAHNSSSKLLCAESQHVSRGANSVQTLDATQVCSRFAHNSSSKLLCAGFQ
jgi:hypothetical protein